jgi:NADP-dependent 3-hydroxy acid dehydrogenase YdfG
VIYVSSVAGRQASASGYNATNFGVNGFTEGSKLEVAEDGIRTTLIEPGIVDTGLQGHIPDEEIKRETEVWVDSLDPLTGEDIAETIRFAVTRPRHVSVNELLIRSTQQEM